MSDNYHGNEIKIVGRDYGKAYSTVIYGARDIVNTVYMPEVATLYAVGNQNVHNFLTYKRIEYGREVEEHENFLVAVSS